MEDSCSENKKQKKEEEPKAKSKNGEIVEEGDTNNARPITDRASKNLYNSIFRINGGNIIGTGFFIKLNLNNETKLFLVTCYHIIPKKLVDEKKTITLYYGEFEDEKSFKIKLDKNERIIKCFKSPKDVTLIEIIDKDDIRKDKFLFPELN